MPGDCDNLRTHGTDRMTYRLSMCSDTFIKKRQSSCPWLHICLFLTPTEDEMRTRLYNISPVWQQAFRQQVSRPVDFFVVVSKLGMTRVGGQQYGCLWWTVNLVAQNALLHLQEEKLLGDVLDELLRHILWKELGPKLELQRVLLLNVLGRHLGRKYSTVKHLIWFLLDRAKQAVCPRFHYTVHA